MDTFKRLSKLADRIFPVAIPLEASAPAGGPTIYTPSDPNKGVTTGPEATAHPTRAANQADDHVGGEADAASELWHLSHEISKRGRG